MTWVWAEAAYYTDATGLICLEAVKVGLHAEKRVLSRRLDAAGTSDILRYSDAVQAVSSDVIHAWQAATRLSVVRSTTYGRCERDGQVSDRDTCLAVERFLFLSGLLTHWTACPEPPTSSK
jgi:hypothetical protein